MSKGQGIKLVKTQKLYPPEVLEANALEACSITAAFPWLVRLNHYADESGNPYWKKRVKEIYVDYGFDIGEAILTVGGSNNQLGERFPPENLQESNTIFVTQIYKKKLNLKRLWEWTLDNFVDNINHRYEWVSGLLFFGNKQLLIKELNNGLTPTTKYGKQMRDWFGQFLNVECTDDQINEYRNGFFKSIKYNYSVWLNDLTGGPQKGELCGDQSIDGFSNIKNLCKKLENNFNLNNLLITP